MPSENPCRCCCCHFIFTLGLSALFLWLSLRSSSPTASIESFTLPALNATNSSAATAAGSGNITFLLKLNNPNKDKGIDYDDVRLSFFLLANKSDPRSSSTLVGNYTVPRFYQGHKKSAKKNGTLGTSGVYWVGVIAGNHTPTAFRVDLATRVRFKIMFWRTSRRGVRVGGVVEVDEMGDRVRAKKGVKLKSGAAAPPLVGWSVLVLGLVGFFVLGFLDLGR